MQWISRAKFWQRKSHVKLSFQLCFEINFKRKEKRNKKKRYMENENPSSVTFFVLYIYNFSQQNTVHVKEMCYVYLCSIDN